MTDHPRSAKTDQIVAALGWASTAAVVGCFAWLLVDVLLKGAGQLSWEFFTAEPADAGRRGGIGSLLVSTALILTVCLVVAVPLGVGSAAWLAEFTTPTGRPARIVRRSLDLLASVPSIIFGLFGMVCFCQWMRLGFSILSGGLTLAAMVLPIVVQTSYVGFRSVPDELRQAAAAAGMRRCTTLWYLLLPAASHAIIVATILGIGRAAAETAALLFTSGYVTRMPHSLLDSGRTLSVHIYDLALNVPGGEARAYATALTLMAMLLAINFAAQRLARRWSASFHPTR